MNVKSKEFDTDKAKRLTDTAMRSIEIIRMISNGHDSGKIVKVLGAERSLVHYYMKVLTR
jgi:hypothetical protein